MAPITTTLSHRYGLYHITNANSSRNQAPQRLVLNASTRLTTGLAMSTNSSHRTPAQNSMAKKMPTNTIAVPRSGCSMMSSHGTATTSAGFHSSISDRGASRLAASTLASIITTAILASSEGCPSRTPPRASQLLELAAVPAPLPTNSSSTSTATLPR